MEEAVTTIRERLFCDNCGEEIHIYDDGYSDNYQYAPSDGLRDSYEPTDEEIKDGILPLDICSDCCAIIRKSNDILIAPHEAALEKARHYVYRRIYDMIKNEGGVKDDMVGKDDPAKCQ